MIVIRLLDVYWVVEPAFYNQQLKIHWMDFVTPVAIGGLWLALFFWQLKSRPLVPLTGSAATGRAARNGRILNGTCRNTSNPIEQTGHEVEDAHVLPVVVTLAGLAVGAMLVALLVYGIFRYLADHPLSEMPPNPMAETRPSSSRRRRAWKSIRLSRCRNCTRRKTRFFLPTAGRIRLRGSCGFRSTGRWSCN